MNEPVEPSHLDPSAKPSPDYETIGAFIDAASQLARVGSAVIGLAAIAYLVGLARLRGYYAAFGATWILDSLPASAYMLKSVAPLCYLLAAVAVVAAKISAGRQLMSARTAVLYLMAVSLVAMAIAAWTGWWLAVIASWVSVISWMFAAATEFGELAISLRSSDRRWASTHVATLLVFVWFGLYFAPERLGNAEGQRDNDLEHSTLPFVQISKSGADQGRLLYSDGHSAIVVLLADGDSRPKIQLFPATELKWIVGDAPSISEEHPIKPEVEGPPHNKPMQTDDPESRPSPTAPTSMLRPSGSA